MSVARARPPRLRGAHRLALAAALLLTSACSLSGAPSALRPTRHTAADPGEAAELYADLTERSRAILGARSLYSVTLKKGIEKQRLKQVIVFERPEKLRAEFFLPGIHQTSALIVAHDGILESIDVTRKAYVRGAASSTNARRLLAIPFELEELMLWTVGAVLLPESAPPGSAFWTDAKNGKYYGKVPLSEQRTLRVEFERKDGMARLLTVEMLDADGEERSFVSQFSYPEEGDASLPKMIKFWVLEESLSGELERESTELNPAELSPSLFRVFAPRSYSRTDLDAPAEGAE